MTSYQQCLQRMPPTREPDHYHKQCACGRGCASPADSCKRQQHAVHLHAILPANPKRPINQTNYENCISDIIRLFNIQQSLTTHAVAVKKVEMMCFDTARSSNIYARSEGLIPDVLVLAACHEAVEPSGGTYQLRAPASRPSLEAAESRKSKGQMPSRFGGGHHASVLSPAGAIVPTSRSINYRPHRIRIMQTSPKAPGQPSFVSSASPQEIVDVCWDFER